eukprot:275413_1
MLSSLRIISHCILLLKYNQTAAEEEKQQHQHALQILDELNMVDYIIGIAGGPPKEEEPKEEEPKEEEPKEEEPKEEPLDGRFIGVNAAA